LLVSLGLSPIQSNALGLDSATFFFHPRFYADIAPFVDPALNHVDMFSWHSHYPGSGWAAQTTSTHEYVADAKEAYVDLRKDRLWLRLGKQQIEFGAGVLLRTLDVVQSLDFRRNLFIDNILKEWNDELIGQWSARLTYSIPDLPEWNLVNMSITGILSPDFEPDYLPAPGTWYSAIPSNTILADQANIARARHKLVYGGVLAGTLESVDYTLNFYSTPQDFGYLFLDQCHGPQSQTSLTAGNLLGLPVTGPGPTPGCIPGTPFVVDPKRGVPLLAAPLASLNPLNVNLNPTQLNPTTVSLIKHARANPARVSANAMSFPGFVGALPTLLLFNPPLDNTLNRAFPRMFVYGGSLSYTMPSSFDFFGSWFVNGDILRTEVAYEPNKAFTTPGLTRRPIREGQLSLVFEMEKYARLSERTPATYFVMQYWYDSSSDLLDGLEASQGISSGEHLVTFAFVQNLFQSTLVAQNVFTADVVGGGGFWEQPAITYKPASDTQWRVLYDFFTGGNQTVFGRATTYDQVILQYVHQF
jgi:hypothetical protein